LIKEEENPGGKKKKLYPLHKGGKEGEEEGAFSVKRGEREKKKRT